MKLSAPIYHLKRKAKSLSRSRGIRLYQALDQVAIEEGFSSWSHLSSHNVSNSPAQRLFAQIENGDLVLVGARPGQGKTRLCLEVAVEAMEAGSRAMLFTLEYSKIDVIYLFRMMGRNLSDFTSCFEFDTSDSICADHIITKLAGVPKGTIVVIDYLQALDQSRSKPDIELQVKDLKEFVQEKQIVLLFISQIDRFFDLSKNKLPKLSNVRLPNPLNLSYFTKTCFLSEGEVCIS
ncbi:MAG: DNA helicase [Pseudomonadales bacterium]|nr:DNA helicase [Pseudomonadales bacterium]